MMKYLFYLMFNTKPYYENFHNIWISYIMMINRNKWLLYLKVIKMVFFLIFMFSFIKHSFSFIFFADFTAVYGCFIILLKMVTFYTKC